MRHNISILFLLGIFLISPPSPGHAQSTDPAPAIREINRPVLEQLMEKLKLPVPQRPEIEAPPPEEKPVEGPRFFIRSIKITGMESFPPEKFDALKKKYEQHDVSMGELTMLSKEIMQEYLKSGILATCFIPQQHIAEGNITLQVLEARMGDLHVNDHKYFRKNRITYYWKVPQGEIIKYSKVLEGLSLINKNPDRKAKAIFSKGTKPRTTDVTLDVKTHFPLHFNYSIDNEGVTSTGKVRSTVGARQHNLLGLDDTLLAGYLFGQDFDGIYTYHSVPVTNFGTTLVYGHTLSKASPKKEFESSGIHAKARDMSVAVHQDIFWKGQYTGDVHLGLDVQDHRTVTNSGTTSRDRLRVIRVGYDRIYRKFNRAISLTTELSQGINGLGSRRNNPLASRGAENTFSKMNLTLQTRYSPLWDLQGNFQLKAQTTNERLAPQEGFYLGGMSSVRGYPSGDFLADDAVQINSEIILPTFFIPANVPMPFSKRPLKKNVTFVGFLDYAWGNKQDHLAGEKDTANLMGTGAGFRVLLMDKASLRIEWGFPIGDKTITESGKSRFHCSLDFEF
ncbi:MAG: ShlB/FhaC/HecB family hemolysin secretion/activation protein [Candidatus Omnitrophica bacterium]|nr:ShlB/FhaC/HecB family hemolysin secretion/activation protein [Candidatus Omnitrophota bacterium]